MVTLLASMKVDTNVFDILKQNIKHYQSQFDPNNVIIMIIIIIIIFKKSNFEI